MKRTRLFFALIILTAASAFAQHRETVELEDFDRVKLDGNIRLYIAQASDTKVDFETRRASHLDDYRMEVRNKTLYIQYDDTGFGSTPKIKVYIEHPELKGIDADGLVHVHSDNTIRGESFAMKGDGLIRGELAVDVEKLRVDLDGLCFMRFEGKAKKSYLRLDGLGRINASDLESIEIDSAADGLAGIRVD